MITTMNQHKRDSFESVFLRGGAVFIILGILSATFELVTFSYYSENFKSTDSRHMLTYVGTGIWCGALFFIVGISTVVVAKKLTPRLVLFAIALAVAVVIVGATQLTIEVIAAGTLSSRSSNYSSSVRSLHAMLGCIAILAIISATVELVLFFRISFCFLSTALPHRGFSNSSNYSQTEMTKDFRDRDEVVFSNASKIKLVFRKPEKTSEVKVISSLSGDAVQTV